MNLRAVFLLMLALALVLSGCGGDSEKAKPAAKDEPAPAKTDATGAEQGQGQDEPGTAGKNDPKKPAPGAVVDPDKTPVKPGAENMPDRPDLPGFTDNQQPPRPPDPVTPENPGEDPGANDAPKAPPAAPEGYDDKQLKAFFAAVTKFVFDEGRPMPASKPLMMQTVGNAAQLAQSTLTDHPEGATVVIKGTAGPLRSKEFRACSNRLILTLATDKDKYGFVVVLTDSKTATFVALDDRQRGRNGFDKDGYARSTGPCVPGIKSPKATITQTAVTLN